MSMAYQLDLAQNKQQIDGIRINQPLNIFQKQNKNLYSDLVKTESAGNRCRSCLFLQTLFGLATKFQSAF